MVKMLFYDIETTPLTARLWRLGKQVVRHHQLVKTKHMFDIICIAYCWNDGKPAQSLDWGYQQQNSKLMINTFDQIIQQADIVIGKNSDSFDARHINSQRLLHKLTPLPNWVKYTDDLEKQLRKHFMFPSYSLDYVSNLLNLGGKLPMEFEDWIKIEEKTSKKTFKKMITYCKKDVEDTRTIFEKIYPHIEPKLNLATLWQDQCCKYCGSTNIRRHKQRYKGQTLYFEFFCNNHQGYAGCASVTKTKKGVLRCNKIQ